MTKLQELKDLEAKCIEHAKLEPKRNNFVTQGIFASKWFEWKHKESLLSEEYIKLEKEINNMNKSMNYATINTKENTKENNTMVKNNKETRMETLKNAGINTNNFFNVNLNVPIGATVKITVDGDVYNINTNGNEVKSIIKLDNNGIEVDEICLEDVSDNIVKEIVNNGYVFNRRTDGRWMCAQTFRMLNSETYNYNTHMFEHGWDAYLRNSHNYYYQFEAMLDEIHRIAKMERQNDPEFNVRKLFFTREVVVETCKQYIRQLKKFVAIQPIHKCKRKPYVTLERYGHVFLTDLNERVYKPLEHEINSIKCSYSYVEIERNLRMFMNKINNLPFYTPKCSQWKAAYKGLGAYVTLMNIVKFHDVKIDGMSTIDSVSYLNVLCSDNKYIREPWRFHELLKKVISDNNFDLSKSIEAHKN